VLHTVVERVRNRNLNLHLIYRYSPNNKQNRIQLDIYMASTKGSQLLNAACDGNLQEIQRIMFRCEPGIVNTMDQFGQTALLKACWRGHKSVVRFLLDNNASTDLASRNGFTPLMVACEKGYVDIVNALLEKGANMEATSDYGETALMWASFKGHTDIVHVLLNKGADPNAVSKKKWTALMWASSFGHTGVVLALLDKNAKLRLKNSRNKTARDLAKECQKFDIAALLLRFVRIHTIFVTFYTLFIALITFVC